MPQPLPWHLELTPEPAKGLALSFEFDAGTSRLLVSATNASRRAISPRHVRFTARLDAPAVGGWAWLHGRYMQMDAMVRAFGEPLPEGYAGLSVRKLARGGGRYVSREQMALVLPARHTTALVIGCLRMDRFFLDIEIETGPLEASVASLTLSFDLDGVELAPGESLALPPVFIAEGPDPVALLERYAEDTAREMAARVPDRVPAGWCSWYYFYGRVTEADVLANLEAMVRDGHPADYLQIDDGYQSHTGDWLVPNAKFPSGMAALAGRIRAAGYRPGLWLAPLLLNEASATLRDRPEMALHDRAGETLFVETWLGRCAVLDCTRPSSEAWLREVVGTVVKGWGYEYLKLDALAFGAQAASDVNYFVPGTTAAANLRRGLEVIREAAGEATFILGCTCHFGPAIGLVDAMRVGPDVKEVWADGPNPSVRHALRLTLQRNWMHGRWWSNDPDCLIVRDTDTSLDEAEVRFLATGIALSGGMVVASDDLPQLSPARRDLALALFPPVGIAARPVIPGEAPVPSVWRTALGEGRSLVGVLNWADEPRWVVLSEWLEPGEVAFDLWGGRVLGAGDVLLRPHEGALWQVAAPGPTPRVVGDTGHVNYEGLFQRPVSGRLQLRNDLPRARTVAVEARGSVVTVDLSPGESRWFD